MKKKNANIFTVVLLGLFLSGYSLWSYLKPADRYSESERRTLPVFEKPTAQTVMNGSFMQNFETYVVDQLPLRDSLRTVKAMVSTYLLRLKDNNKIYIADGYASKLEYPLVDSSLTHAADRFRFIYENYLKGKGGSLYLSVVPDKNYFLAGQNGYPSLDYEELVKTLRRETDFLTYIDLFPVCELSDYYRTDTHWRQENLLKVAQTLAKAMGVSLSAEYKTETLPNPFYGVYYGQAALPISPEPLHYLTNDILSEVTVFDAETNKTTSVYDMEKAAGRDPYEMFLSGSKSFLTITNKKATTDKELIIFRDSFGSSLTPLLCEAYQTITLVDIRYLSPQMLPMLLDFTDKDVLFLYSSLVLNNSDTIK